MAPLRSPDHCASIAALHGADHRYARDCLVRHLRSTGWQGALELGHDPTQTLTVIAGIGTLTMTATATTFEPPPGIRASLRPAPLPAPPDLAIARRATCAQCSRWSDNGCTVAGCSCAGLARPDALLSRCPLNAWPSAPSLAAIPAAHAPTS